MIAEKFSVHNEPVWRARSNFIILAPLPEEGRYEQLWCRDIGDDKFEVCCIPFFLYDIALGDIVQSSQQPEGKHLVVRVLSRSGRSVFRVYFDRSMRGNREGVAAQLTGMGGLLEWSSASLLAVDARDAAHSQEIASFLFEQEGRSRLVYETGRSA